MVISFKEIVNTSISVLWYLSTQHTFLIIYFIFKVGGVFRLRNKQHAQMYNINIV
jgi:hypothetical protein